MKQIKFMALAAASILGLATANTARADEGMWLPVNIKRLNYADMKKMGLKLTADELYSINNPSTKDAIVHFGGFCTGEVISSQGLVLTNHHCGYDALQSHSTVDNNILHDGFWAKQLSEEKPVPGLFVKFMTKMDDVSARVLSKVNDKMTESERAMAVAGEVALIKKEAAPEGSGLTAEVKDFFNGNEYYLMVYEIFNDVRLVGAPPEAIGKFGGDTDNWMWPRHTGDFSMFRIYAGPDNKPAAYSAQNVPLKPRHFFPVNIGGVKPGDFSMVFGYPGKTDRYLTSNGVKLALDMTDPTRVKIRAKKLDIMKADMDKDPKVRIQYASKHASIANYWKFFIGEQRDLKFLNTVGQKQAEEANFAKWAAANPERQAKYGTVLKDLEDAYNKRRQYEMANVYFGEAVVGPEIHQMADHIKDVADAMGDSTAGGKENLAKAMEDLKGFIKDHFKDYNMATDKKLFSAMMMMYSKDVPQDQQPAYFKEQVAKYKGDFDAWATDMFNTSNLASMDKLNAALAKNDKGMTLLNDPAVKNYSALLDNFISLGQTKIKPISAELAKANRLYVDGTRQMLEGKKTLSPNANSTMRMTYGSVRSYESRDAVKYDYFTTIEGIMEKEDSTNEEFVVPKKLKELYKKKDYGQYGENGTLPVGFLTNNDITGGNSGSPVLNARGEIIGVAFDGNWEAMSGNIAFYPAKQRTIICDIRYVLFCIDKMGGAQNLIREMKIVRDRPTQTASATAKPAAAKGKPAASAKKMPAKN